MTNDEREQLNLADMAGCILGARVRYNGSIWRSTVNDNVWAPGVYGWEALP